MNPSDLEDIKSAFSDISAGLNRLANVFAVLFEAARQGNSSAAAAPVEKNAPNKRSAVVMDDVLSIPSMTAIKEMNIAGEPSSPVTPSTSKKVKKMKDPNAPKKAMNGYMLFCQDERNAVIEKNPGIRFTDLGKMLGEMWKNADKVAWEAKAKQRAEQNAPRQGETITGKPIKGEKVPTEAGNALQGVVPTADTAVGEIPDMDSLLPMTPKVGSSQAAATTSSASVVVASGKSPKAKKPRKKHNKEQKHEQDKE